MTKTREVVAPRQAESWTTRTVNEQLVQLAAAAHANAERCRRQWHMARRTKASAVVARIRRRMLKHQVIAYQLDTECRGCREPR
jgi:hypothetical protein